MYRSCSAAGGGGGPNVRCGHVYPFGESAKLSRQFIGSDKPRIFRSSIYHLRNFRTCVDQWPKFSRGIPPACQFDRLPISDFPTVAVTFQPPNFQPSAAGAIVPITRRIIPLSIKPGFSVLIAQSFAVFTDLFFWCIRCSHRRHRMQFQQANPLNKIYLARYCDRQRPQAAINADRTRKHSRNYARCLLL